ncbi:hypothetical protein C2E23DRAFT_824337 [Lenzites betulinus]|nr:hypothetical protein C2E23DRAFT_824337 [Lenzites betulinus]
MRSHTDGARKRGRAPAHRQVRVARLATRARAHDRSVIELPALGLTLATLTWTRTRTGRRRVTRVCGKVHCHWQAGSTIRYPGSTASSLEEGFARGRRGGRGTSVRVLDAQAWRAHCLLCGSRRISSISGQKTDPTVNGDRSRAAREGRPARGRRFSNREFDDICQDSGRSGRWEMGTRRAGLRAESLPSWVHSSSLLCLESRGPLRTPTLHAQFNRKYNATQCARSAQRHQDAKLQLQVPPALGGRGIQIYTQGRPPAIQYSVCAGPRLTT